jgi:hypothetical protein
MFNFKKPTAEQVKMLRATASSNAAEAIEHRQAFAALVEGAWKAGVLEPDTLTGIFDRIGLEAGSDAKFPFDLYSPAEQGFYKAFVCPKEGAIPDQVVEGDEIYVPTYKIANSISWSIDYARDARWDIIARALNVFANGFTQKMNDDGWHVVLKAAVTNTVISDSVATSGIFTKQLVLNLMTGIKRLTGGRNSLVTDIFVSPEGLADIRNLTNTSVDDATLRSLILTPGLEVPSLFGVKLRELQELGSKQEYQTYLTGTLSASLAGSGDNELCVALDLKNRDSFVMPVREDMKMFDDPTLHRSARAGVYGWMELGFAALDTRRAMLGSF